METASTNSEFNFRIHKFWVQLLMTSHQYINYQTFTLSEEPEISNSIKQKRQDS